MTTTTPNYPEPPSLRQAWDDLREAHQQLAHDVAAAGLPAGRFLFIDWEPISGFEELQRHIGVLDLFGEERS